MDEQDPLAPIREHEEVIREKVVEGKDDDLAAWGRVLLALANNRPPASEDLRTLGISEGGEYERVLDAPVASGQRPSNRDAARQVRRVLNAARESGQARQDP